MNKLLNNFQITLFLFTWHPLINEVSLDTDKNMKALPSQLICPQIQHFPLRSEISSSIIRIDRDKLAFLKLFFCTR